MTATTLDPKTALVVVDLQKGIAGYPTVHPMADVLRNAAALLDAFRAKSLPVVLVHALGVAPGRAEQQRPRGAFAADFAEFLPELRQQPSDHVVAKHTWGAFTNTDLEAWLKSQGATQVVVIGVATSAGVESTARFAHELGFNVALAVDAMTDTSADAHANSVARIFPRIGETATTAEIVALLHGAQA